MSEWDGVESGDGVEYFASESGYDESMYDYNYDSEYYYETTQHMEQDYYSEDVGYDSTFSNYNSEPEEQADPYYPWSQHWDDDGGAWYYYNSETGVSTYEPPKHWEGEAAEEVETKKIEYLAMLTKDEQITIFNESKSIVNESVSTTRNQDDMEKNHSLPREEPDFFDSEEFTDPRRLWNIDNFDSDIDIPLLTTRRYMSGNETKITVKLTANGQNGTQIAFKVKDRFMRSHLCTLSKDEVMAVLFFDFPTLREKDQIWELVHTLCDLLTFKTFKNDSGKLKLVVQQISSVTSKGKAWPDKNEDENKSEEEKFSQVEEYEGQLERQRQYKKEQEMTSEEKALQAWIRCWDDTHSAYYFYNVDTLESSWDAPEGWTEEKFKSSSDAFVKACLRLQACIRAFRTRKRKAEFEEYMKEIRSERQRESRVIVNGKDEQDETYTVRTNEDVTKNEDVPRLEPTLFGEDDPRAKWSLKNFAGSFFLLETKRFIGGKETHLSLEMKLNKIIITITDLSMNVYTLPVLRWEIEELMRDDWPSLLWPEQRWHLVHKLCDMVTFSISRKDRRKKIACLQRLRPERRKDSSKKIPPGGKLPPIGRELEEKKVDEKVPKVDELVEDKRTLMVREKEMKLSVKKKAEKFTMILQKAGFGKKGLILHARNVETLKVTTLSLNRVTVAKSLGITPLEAALLEKPILDNEHRAGQLKSLIDMAVLKNNPFDKKKKILAVVTKEMKEAEEKKKAEEKRKAEEKQAKEIADAEKAAKKKGSVTKLRTAAMLAKTMKKPLTKEEKAQRKKEKKRKKLAEESAFRLLGRSLYNQWLKKDDFTLIERAYKAYEKGMASIESATNPQNLYALSRVYMAYTSYQSALEIQSRIISSFPTFPQLFEVIFDAAVVLSLSGSYDQARQYYSYVSGEQPYGLSEEAIVFQIARTYNLEGKESESTSAFIALFRAQRISGKIRRTLSYEEWFWGKTVWEQFGDIYMARNVFSLGADCYYEAMRRVTGNRADIPLLFKLGNAYYRTHQNEPAKQCAESVLAENPFHREAREKLQLWDPEDRGKSLKEQEKALSKVQGMIRRKMAVVLRRKRNRAAQCMRRCAQRWIARRKLQRAQAAMIFLWDGWMEEASEESRKHEKMKSFLAKLKGENLHECFANWKTYIALRRSGKRAARKCFAAWRGEWYKARSRIKANKEKMLRFQLMMGNKMTVVCMAAWKSYTLRCRETKYKARRQLNRGLYKCLCAWRDWALERAKARKQRELEDALASRRLREKELFLAEQKRRAEARAQRERERLAAEKRARQEAAWLAANMEKVESHRRKFAAFFCARCLEHWKEYHKTWGVFARCVRKYTHKEMQQWLERWKIYTTAHRNAEHLVLYRIARFGSARYFDWFEIIDEGRANESHINAAIVMQRGFRHLRQVLLWRRYVGHVIRQMQYHISNVQRVWRGKMARNRYRKSIPGVALLEIQRLARGHLARRKTNGIKNGVRLFWAALMLEELGVPAELAMTVKKDSKLIDHVHENFPLEYPGRLRGMNPDSYEEGRLVRTPRIFQKYRDSQIEPNEEISIEMMQERRTNVRAMTSRMKKKGLPQVMKRKRKRADDGIGFAKKVQEIPDSNFSHGSKLISTYVAPSKKAKKNFIKRQREMYRNDKPAPNLRRDQGLERSFRHIQKRLRHGSIQKRRDVKRRKRRQKQYEKELAKLLIDLED